MLARQRAGGSRMGKSSVRRHLAGLSATRSCPVGCVYPLPHVFGGCHATLILLNFAKALPSNPFRPKPFFLGNSLN